MWIRLTLFLLPVLVSAVYRMDLRRPIVIWRNWNHTLLFDKVGFTEVVSEIRSGVLRPDRKGQILLPETLRGLTGDGCVYVTHDTEKRLLIFFPTDPLTWSFPSAHFFSGYLYCDESVKRLTDAVVTINCPPETPQEISFDIKSRSSRGWFTALADD